MNRIRISFRRAAWALPLGIALTAGLVQAQQQPAANAAGDQKTIKSTAEEVVLDVVVRDKKGRTIKDLTADDFQVVDNGTKQTIKGFRLVQGNEAIEKGSTVTLDPMRQLRLVTICFRGTLGQDSKRTALKAIDDLIKGAEAQNVYYSVVKVDQTLVVLQPFTKDASLLKKAAEHAIAGISGSKYIEESEAIKSQLRSMVGPANGAQGMQEQVSSIANNTGSSPNAAPTNPGGFAQAKMAQMMLDMVQFNESMTGDQWDRLNVFALLSLVRGQMSLPGRKTLLYIAEGMHIPDFLEEPFRNIISAANRANVSIYPIDPRGVSSENTGSGMLADALKSSASQQTADGGAVRPDQVKAQDTAEAGLRANDRLPMENLAQGTGGFLIAQTNDLRGPLKKINEDINSYYEISYNPGIENYDGSFRKTLVTVDRKDLKPQTRSGYFAIPLLAGTAPALEPFELPLLKALDSGSLPKDIDFRSAALHFQPAKDGTVKGAVVVEVPLKNIKFTVDPATNTYKARFSMLAMLKDSNNTIVKKWTRDLPLKGAAAQVPNIQLGNFIYKENFMVPAGKYTLEAAILDREADKMGARKTVYVADAKPSGVALSNISLVRTFAANAKDLDPNDPFQYQGGKITPTLNPNLKAQKGAMLAMFFVVYPDPAIKDKPEITIEYLKDGQPIGSGAVPLPPADANGRIPYIMSSSAEAMPPGSYEIHAVAKQGTSTSEDRTTITVE